MYATFVAAIVVFCVIYCIWFVVYIPYKCCLNYQIVFDSYRESSLHHVTSHQMYKCIWDAYSIFKIIGTTGELNNPFAYINLHFSGRSRSLEIEFGSPFSLYRNAHFLDFRSHWSLWIRIAHIIIISYVTKGLKCS